jgi:TolB-like protein/Tfp pilus assembly protein PilF
LSGSSYALEVLGPFRLCAPGGQRIDISSKKGQALVAMLAVASGGERTRSWLQSQLWGSRGPDQAQASLRSELSSLRSVINVRDQTLIQADHSRIWLDLERVQIDARKIDADARGSFLEGLDIAGEEEFEEWLREERARIAAQITQSASALEPTASMSAAMEIAPPIFASLPAVAVLPFANMTGDPQMDFIVEGISEDLIDRLSRLRWLPIIARSSSFAVRSENPDPKIVGAKLGARYLLEGRVRNLGSEQVLQASLSDCETGNNVWSNKLPLLAHASPNALEELLNGLTNALGAKIDYEEQSRALRKPQSDLNVRDLIWHGRWHLNRFTGEDSTLAKEYFAQALAQEPNSPEALIQSTWAVLWDLWAQRGSEEEIRRVRQMAQKAIIADYDDARGHMLAGIAECWLRQPIRAEALLRRAIALNPSLVLAYGELGSVLYLKGQAAEAIEVLNLAIRLSPNDQSMFYILSELAMSHLMLGNYTEAAVLAENAIMNRSAYWYGHVIKINALVRNGNLQDARSAFADLRQSNAQFEASYIDWLPFIDSKWNAYLKEGLNLSGS